MSIELIERDGTPLVAPSVKLPEVLAVLAKATEREWFVGETLRRGSLAVVGDGDSVVCEFRDRVGGAEEDAAAIVAAVNYLRSHGPAVAELVEQRDSLAQALRDVLRTGLNGGNNLRLSFIAASCKELSAEDLKRADESEAAVDAAGAALARATGAQS